ncbi:hypothetical protein CRE_11670 [Caenorhabditis remanei]|uniref:Arrestin C-terminal-like domain-containing protein n=1 Tax=Caenorhabditis remanei TaxID=31234 RepID=E3M408_CAERE|nr:hypothetical protein CRE_11670 [Caenorhabditis remanei]
MRTFTNIHFEGIAHTYWDDDSSVRRTEVAGQKIYYNQRVHYSADVNYLEHKLLLWSSGDGSNELAPGKYEWPFSYLLPNDIPPSFEGKYGYVRYSVTAEVDRPWRFDKAKKLCITGYGRSHLSDSVTHRIEKQETKQDTNTVVKQTQALTVEPGKEHKLVLELRLPSVTPTINQFSPIITVEYLVQLSVDTSIVFGSDINCEMSLLIGTVPIRQYLPPSYYPPNPAFPPAIPTPMPPQIGSGVVVPPPAYGFVPAPADIGTGVVPPYPEGAQPYPTKGDTVGVPSAPPVSYQDSMYGPDGTQLNTDENDKPFVPKYPVFDNLPVYNPSAPPQE